MLALVKCFSTEVYNLIHPDYVFKQLNLVMFQKSAVHTIIYAAKNICSFIHYLSCSVYCNIKVIICTSKRTEGFVSIALTLVPSAYLQLFITKYTLWHLLETLLPLTKFHNHFHTTIHQHKQLYQQFNIKCIFSNIILPP